MLVPIDYSLIIVKVLIAKLPYPEWNREWNPVP
jgi:hypothetical protein